jgi:hypothetical protein
LVIQEALRSLIKTRRIASKDDNALVALVCSLDFEIPELPVWDPYGVILAKVPGYTDFFVREMGRKHGVFYPRQWGLDHTLMNGWTVDKFTRQVAMKAEILKAIYPGLREGTPDQIAQVLIKHSPLTLKAAQQKTFVLPNWNQAPMFNNKANLDTDVGKAVLLQLGLVVKSENNNMQT